MLVAWRQYIRISKHIQINWQRPDRRYIYICIASMIWRFTYICYKSKEQQWKESKNETKREQQTKNTWANNYIVRRISKIRIERKNEERNDTFVHVTKWCIQEKYDNKSIRRLWKLREENKSKQQHTQMKRKSRWLATIHDQLYMISTWRQWLYIGYIVSGDEVDIHPSYYL